jgi:hypothetical protein
MSYRKKRRPIISIIYNYISKRIRTFHINSMPKGIGTGRLAGVIVWGILFLPIHYFVIQTRTFWHGQRLELE